MNMTDLQLCINLYPKKIIRWDVEQYNRARLKPWTTKFNIFAQFLHLDHFHSRLHARQKIKMTYNNPALPLDISSEFPL